MIRGVIGRVFWGVWLGCFMVAAAQLPPEILMDKYLLRAGRLMEAKYPKGALVMMNKIVALQKEHGLTLPNGFHFRYAKVAMASGSVQDAIDAVNTYLLGAGREGHNAACRYVHYMVHCTLKGAGWPTSRSHRKSR